MLLRLDLTNFGAFRDRVSLTLDATVQSDAEVRAVPLAPRTPVLALVYGANASGKTTLLDGLARLVLAVRDSHRFWDPAGGTTANPFLLQSKPEVGPSEWLVRFASTDDSGVPGVFEYDVAMDRQAVRREILRFRSAATGRWRAVFKRTGQLVHSSSQSLKVLAPRLRTNALLLSLAAQENESTTHPAWVWFATQVTLTRDLTSPAARVRAMDRLATSEEMSIARQILQVADLGVTDVRGIPFTASDRARVQDLNRRLTEVLPGASFAAPDGEFKELEFAHTGAEGRQYWMAEDQESEGTRTYLVAGVIAAKALATGGLLVIDELDRSLHPTLVESIVTSFRSRVSNPRGAQLLASTHDTHLFGRSSIDPLSRHEVWFTEKSPEGVASLYRLADFEGVRPGIDQEHRYLAGRFGAVPSPGPIVWGAHG